MALFALERVTLVRGGRVVLGGLDLLLADGATAIVGASGIASRRCCACLTG